MSNFLIGKADILKNVETAINFMYYAAASTLGAGGKTVIFNSPQTPYPVVTKDGVSVISVLEHKDKAVQTILNILKMASLSVVDKEGDGTTTTVVLQKAIFDEFKDKNISKKEMNEICDKIVSRLKSSAKTPEAKDLVSIAQISSNGDEAVTSYIKQAIDKIGVDGLIAYEPVDAGETSVEIIKGYVFERGYGSPYFINVHDKQQVVFENPYILLVNEKIKNIDLLIPALSQASLENRPVVLITGEMEKDALDILIQNLLKKALKIVAIQAPSFARRRFYAMQDLALITGATLIGKEAGIDMSETSYSHFGTCGKVVVTKDETRILEFSIDKELLDSKISELEVQFQLEPDEYTKTTIKERIGTLRGGVAMIKVGAPTPPERKELLDRVDDAVKAVMSAKRGGVVKGGGNALAQLGIPYLRLPISVQLTNSGITEIESNELSEKSYLDPTTGTIKDDFLEDGIVDPLNVVVAAVKTAFSTVSLLLDSSVMLVDETSEK